MKKSSRAGAVILAGGTIVIGVVAIANAPRFGTSEGQPSAAQNGASVAVVAVERGTIRSVVVLDGVAVPSPNSGIAAPASGSIKELRATIGANVHAHQELGRIETTAGLTVALVAPVAGVVRSWSVSVGDQVRRGDLLGEVDSGRFEADVVVAPELLYRFYGPPIAITVKLDKGPAPFECPFGSLGAPISGNETDPSAVPVHLKCLIPEDVRVFAGVRLKLAAVTGESRGALLLPLEAIDGESDRGLVTLVDAEGNTSQRSVVLGLTDGVNIEVVQGLTDGDRVTVPPADAQSTATP